MVCASPGDHTLSPLESLVLADQRTARIRSPSSFDLLHAKSALESGTTPCRLLQSRMAIAYHRTIGRPAAFLPPARETFRDCITMPADRNTGTPARINLFSTVRSMSPHRFPRRVGCRAERTTALGFRTCMLTQFAVRLTNHDCGAARLSTMMPVPSDKPKLGETVVSRRHHGS